MFVDDYPPMKKQINEILKYFDFDRVHKAMVALNWTWARYDTPDFHYAVPSIDYLKKVAREQLERVAEIVIKDQKPFAFLSSGGFQAKYEHGTLSLSFVIWDSFVEVPDYVSNNKVGK